MRSLLLVLLLAGCATAPTTPSASYAGDIRTPWGVEVMSTAGLTLQQRGNEVAFEHRGTPCRATLRDGVLRTADPAAPCYVNMVGVQPFADEQQIVGAYRTADGRLIDVTRSSDAPLLLLTDYRRSVVRALYHRGRGSFTFGPGMVDPTPVAGTITFQPPYTSATLTYASEAPASAARVRFRELPITWRNEDAELHGTLVLPEGGGPSPAVVLTQGSGSTGREAYRTIAHWFADRGVAALMYDRRGVGASKGDTRTTGFPDLAEDAARGAAALKAVAEVDPRRIGVWGQSQGGWIAPLAAARSTDISWVIAQSGPAVTATEQERYRIEQQARAEGYSDEEVAQALAYERLLDRFRREGVGRDELLAFSAKNKGKRWTSVLHLVDQSLPPRLADSRRDRFWLFDPAPEYRKVQVPILVLYGDRDTYVPVEKSAAIWREILAGNGNEHGSVMIMKGAAHGQWLTSGTESFRELVKSPGYHPDYWPALEAWLARYVTRTS